MHKKYQFLILGISTMMLLAGCGSDTQKETQKTTEKAVVTEAATEEAATEEAATEEAATEKATAKDEAAETEAAGAAADSETENVTEAGSDSAGEETTEAGSDSTGEETTEAGSDSADEAATEADSDSADEAATEADSDSADEAATEADSDSADEAVAEADSDSADEASLSDSGEEAETESKELEPINPSDYLIANASDYVTLGEYDGLEAVQYIYEITDDMVQSRIQEDLENAGSEEDVTTPSAEGDTVYVTMTSTISGTPAEDSEAEETYFTIGDAEYGEEFDKQISGLTAGETKDFSISFTDDVWYEEWVDQTVDFHIEVTGVTRMNIPEYDEDYLAEFTAYTTKEDYEASIRQSLEEQYQDVSYSDTVESLFGTAIGATEFNGYPDELYQSSREEMLSFYTMFVGTEDPTEEDILEVLTAFGITEEDIDSEVLSSVNRKLFISAYCQANDVTVTEDEYTDYLTSNAPYYGLDSAAAFEEAYSRDTLVWYLYESKVADLLYQSADITETAYTEDMAEDDLIFEDEEADEVGEDVDAEADAADEDVDAEADAADVDVDAEADAADEDMDAEADATDVDAVEAETEA